MNEYENMEPMYLENEIRACKHVLSDSDGQILGALEGLLNCTTATGIANFLKGVSNETKALLAYRSEIRARMNAMQAALDGEPYEPDEPEAEEPEPSEDEPDEEATPGEEPGE